MNRRQAALLRLLCRSRSLLQRQVRLADLLNVSKATVKRDLAMLRGLGAVVTVSHRRGGFDVVWASQDRAKWGRGAPCVEPMEKSQNGVVIGSEWGHDGGQKWGQKKAENPKARAKKPKTRITRARGTDCFPDTQSPSHGCEYPENQRRNAPGLAVVGPDHVVPPPISADHELAEPLSPDQVANLWPRRNATLEAVSDPVVRERMRQRWVDKDGRCIALWIARTDFVGRADTGLAKPVTARSKTK